MMTDTHTTTGTAPRRDDRFERPVEGRVLAGVAEGLARRLGVGTGWVRLGFVIATLFGGSGILAYLVGWLLMPDERDEESIAQRYLGNIGNWSSWVGVALIGTAVLIVIDQTGLISGDLLFAGVLVALGILLYRGQIGSEAEPEPDPLDPDTTPPGPTSSPPAGESGGPPAGEAPEFDNPDFEPMEVEGSEPPPPPARSRAARAPRPPRPRREPSHLGRLTMATLLLVVGGIAAYDASSSIDVAYGVYLAAVMIVIGSGLLVGAWVGRARWLVVPGLILLPLFIAVSVLPGRFTGEIGHRDLSGVQLLQAGGSDEMAIGEFFVDLRDIPVGTQADLELSLGIGRLIVVIPDDRTVEVSGDVGMGELVFAGASNGGLGVERTRIFGEGAPELRVTTDLGIGQIDVRRRAVSGFGDLPGFECEPSSPDWPFEGELVCSERSR